MRSILVRISRIVASEPMRLSAGDVKDPRSERKYARIPGVKCPLKIRRNPILRIAISVSDETTDVRIEKDVLSLMLFTS